MTTTPTTPTTPNKGRNTAATRLTTCPFSLMLSVEAGKRGNTDAPTTLLPVPHMILDPLRPTLHMVNLSSDHIGLPRVAALVARLEAFNSVTASTAIAGASAGATAQTYATRLSGTNGRVHRLLFVDRRFVDGTTVSGMLNRLLNTIPGKLKQLEYTAPVEDRVPLDATLAAMGYAPVVPPKPAGLSPTVPGSERGAAPTSAGRGAALTGFDRISERRALDTVTGLIAVRTSLSVPAGLIPPHPDEGAPAAFLIDYVATAPVPLDPWDGLFPMDPARLSRVATEGANAPMLMSPLVLPLDMAHMAPGNVAVQVEARLLGAPDPRLTFHAALGLPTDALSIAPPSMGGTSPITDEQVWAARFHTRLHLAIATSLPHMRYAVQGLFGPGRRLVAEAIQYAMLQPGTQRQAHNKPDGFSDAQQFINLTTDADRQANKP